MTSPLWDRVRRGVVLAAAAVAVAYAVPHAGGWSDGSRLAAVESLGARGTFVIDDSVFVGNQDRPGVPPAYAPGDPNLTWGTQDRMFVRGHFLSHHPPVPLVFPAALYRGWLLLGGPPASERPDLFVRWITVATAGLPYVVAVWCVGRLGRVLGLGGPASALLTLSFAAATVAPAYSRQVNAHVVLLAVGAGACLLVAGAEAAGAVSRTRAVGLGTLAGTGYCLDGALGPALVVCLNGYALAAGGWRRAVLVAVAAAPWVVAHHALLYALTGNAISPATDPANWNWPASPFDPDNLTGVGVKHTASGALEYAADMAFGPRGFLSHNLPLALAVAAAAYLLWRAPADRRAVAVAGGWVLLGAAPYVLLSNNLAGACLSVRWFVPFLAPGFWLMALLLRRRPGCALDLAWLTACGLVLGYQMLNAGPWRPEAVPALGLAGAVGLVGWGVIGVLRPPPPR
jgi:hypothetical protein